MKSKMREIERLYAKARATKGKGKGKGKGKVGTGSLACYSSLWLYWCSPPEMEVMPCAVCAHDVI